MDHCLTIAVTHKHLIPFKSFLLELACFPSLLFIDFPRLQQKKLFSPSTLSFQKKDLKDKKSTNSGLKYRLDFFLKCGNLYLIIQIDF